MTAALDHSSPFSTIGRLQGRLEVLEGRVSALRAKQAAFNRALYAHADAVTVQTLARARGTLTMAHNHAVEVAAQLLRDATLERDMAIELVLMPQVGAP